MDHDFGADGSGFFATGGASFNLAKYYITASLLISLFMGAFRDSLEYRGYR